MRPRRSVKWAQAAAMLAAGLLVAGVVLWPAGPGTAPILPASVVLVAWIVWRDLAAYTIPDAPLIGLAVLAALDRAMQPLFQFDWSFAALSFLVDGLVCGGSVLLVRELYFRRRGHDGIGLGDVKLAAVGGLLCGLPGFSIALLVASLGGLAAAWLAGRLKLGQFSRKIPFGAIFAPMLLIVWLVQA